MAGGRAYTDAEDEAIREAYRKHRGDGGWAIAAAKAIGRSKGSVVQRKSALVMGGKWDVELPPPSVDTVQGPAGTDDLRDVAAPFSDAPYSVDDLVEMFKIDLSVWEPAAVTPNIWQIGAKHPETGAILTRNLYQTKVRFRRKPGATFEQLREALLRDIIQENRRRARGRSPLPRKLVGDPCAMELDVFDLHVGKYAWSEETGQDYDSDLAERIATAAVADLLAQAKGYAIEEVILPLGQDFFHYDNPQGQTTSGTQMDRDTRFQRMFRMGRGIASWMIEQCAAVAPVRVIVVPGNHDTTAAFTLGVVMEAEFKNDPRVTFDNSPRKRKYHRYGKTLLGFAHGHEGKPQEFPQLMAVEEPEAWALTTVREFHLGHIHTGRKKDPITVDDKTGVTVRWIRSLSGTDGWHDANGFLNQGKRNAEAFLWRKAGGMRAHFVSLPVEELLAP